MKSRDFCYWLQGLFELQDPVELNAVQTSSIRRHLNMVFAHEIDPSMGDEAEQSKLNHIHTPPVHTVSAASVKPSDLTMRC